MKEKFKDEYLKKVSENYSEFKLFQDIIWKTLVEVDRICRVNNITYYLAYGSLLGAVRDKGQIPWDYDIDIWVRYEDRLWFINAIKQDISHIYYFQTRHESKNCRHYIMRIASKEYETEVLHVDVFWLHSTDATPSTISKAIKIYSKCRDFSLWSLGDPIYFFPPFLNRLTAIVYKFKRNFYRILPDRWLDFNYFRANNMLKDGNTYLCDEYDYFDSEWFSSSLDLTLDDGFVVSIPSGYLKILNKCYGEWQRWLPLEQRISEMESSLKRLKQFAKINR